MNQWLPQSENCHADIQEQDHVTEIASLHRENISCSCKQPYGKEYYEGQLPTRKTSCPLAYLEIILLTLFALPGQDHQWLLKMLKSSPIIPWVQAMPQLNHAEVQQWPTGCIGWHNLLFMRNEGEVTTLGLQILTIRDFKGIKTMEELS